MPSMDLSPWPPGWCCHPPMATRMSPGETLAPGAGFHGQVSPRATLKFYLGVSKGFGKNQHG